MEFLKKFYQSLYDFRWLATKRTETKKNWQYFFLLVLFVSFLSVLPAIWGLPMAVDKGKDFLDKNVPDFMAEMKGGELTVTGLEQPFVREIGDEKERAVLVVDTVATNTVEVNSFIRTSTDNVILLTKNSFTIRNGNMAKTEIRDWKNVPNGQLDKNTVMRWADSFRGKWVYLFTAILFVLLFVGTVISRIIFIAFMSLWIWIVARIAKRELTYGNVFVMGLLAITLPLVFQVFLGYIHASLSSVGTLFYWLLMLFAVFSLPKQIKPTSVSAPVEK